jgi:hypothetical protein
LELALGDFEKYLPSRCHPPQIKGLAVFKQRKNDVREMPVTDWRGLACTGRREIV